MVSRYELHENVTSKGNIKLYINRPVRNAITQKIVKPPSFIERLFGVTFEQKVIKARQTMQTKCDKLNKKIEEAEKLSKELKLDLSNPPQGGSCYPSVLPKED